MKRIGMLFMLLFVVLGLKAQDYDKMWKSVDAAANKDLPQTALAEVKKFISELFVIIRKGSECVPS